ncbi:hypothetical protein SLEP1_g31925 [Rubroshorea leprosula]|uniref:Uncharacterized protein n=1 Tax=Rubroshorea leprosula TaxID=152421 RepID=A0AAV5KBR1_9ROSI|nr:hypothetical protein SLEP1_g31925 [Rubroshorea leprosula]
MEGIPWEQAVVKDEQEQGRWKIWRRWSRKRKATLGRTEEREREDGVDAEKHRVNASQSFLLTWSARLLKVKEVLIKVRTLQEEVVEIQVESTLVCYTLMHGSDVGQSFQSPDFGGGFFMVFRWI